MGSGRPHARYQDCRFHEGDRYARVTKFRQAPGTPELAQNASQPIDVGTDSGFGVGLPVTMV